MRWLATLSGVRPAARLARRRPGLVLLFLAGSALVLAWPARGKEPGVPRFPDYVSAVAFSPDGRTLAVAEGNIISLWEMASGEDRLCIRAYATVFLSFSPDGRHLASTAADGRVTLWDAATGRRRFTWLAPWGDMPDIPVSELGHCEAVFSPDGKTLAVGRGTAITLWETATGKVRTTLKGGKYPVNELAFSPDGKLLVSAQTFRNVGEVRLWDLATRRERRTLDGHTGPAWSIAFSPNGKVLAVAGAEERIRLWNTSSWKKQADIDHTATNPMMRLMFSPDGKLLAAHRLNGVVTLWAVGGAAPKEKATLNGRPGSEMFVSGVAFSPDGKTFVMGGGPSGPGGLGLGGGIGGLGGGGGALGFAGGFGGGFGMQGFRPPGEVKLWNVPAGRERRWPSKPGQQ